MSQYINLLGSAFRKQRQGWTLTRTLIALGLTLLVMLGLQVHDQEQLSGLREELAAAEKLVKAQSVHTDRLKGEGAAKPGNTGLNLEVQRLEGELKAARDSMAMLEKGVLGNRNGFARYLQAFSRQSIDGLWLTGFSVAGSGDVAIQGRVIRPELVPAYIQKLNHEPALQGRAFSTLELRRPAPAVNAVPVREGEKPVVEAPRYLEFALASGEPTDATGARK